MLKQDSFLFTPPLLICFNETLTAFTQKGLKTNHKSEILFFIISALAGILL